MICSNASLSAPAPDPRAIARSMLSFGIEYERAFSTAFWSARLLAGSGPPSRAATMIARASLEKSLPRLASAAPFLCLIELHLLCPDIRLLPDEVEEPVVHPRIVGQLGMEGRDDESPLAQEHRLAVEVGQHLDVGASLSHPRSTDEHSSQRLAIARKRQVGLEARHLAPVGVAVDLEVDAAQVVPVEHDHACAGAEHGTGEPAHGLVEPVEAHQAHERRRLAAGDHEPVQALELLGLAHLDRAHAEAAQHREVLAEVAL